MTRKLLTKAILAKLPPLYTNENKKASETKVPLKLVRAIADDTIIPSFYETLSRDLRARGVEPGSKVQVRAKFSSSHEMLDPALKGVKILCEVDVSLKP